MFRVLLIEQVVAPYRVPFFERLSSSPELEMTFAYGPATADQTMVSPKHPPLGWQVIDLSNLYWRGSDGLCWQRGVLPNLRFDLFDAVIAEFNPRIITNVLACVLAARSGTPFIWWGHGLSRRHASPIITWIRKNLVHLAKATILYDEGTRQKLISLGVPPWKLFVAHNAIDTHTIGRIREKLEGSKKFRILYVGRFTARKKLPILLQGFAEARSKLPIGTVLTLIGDGPEYSALHSLASKIGLTEAVEFPGAIYDEHKIAPYFAEALLCVCSGPVGLMAIHSLAYGLPLLAARDEEHGPEMNALEPGNTVVLFPSNSPEALAKEMVNLIADSSKREEMARLGLEVVAQRYSLEAMVSSFEAAVQFATHRRSRQ